MELRESAHTNELSVKFDNLLHQFLVYLKELIMDEQIMDEMLLVFQNKILPIKTTKSIQFVVFAIAESSKGCSSRFISFLLGNIFDNRYDGTDFNKVNRMKFNSK
jgi:RNA polymerase I specific transcription initiation factor RRN3